jgi:aminoglycoside phosphotransferase (APT) family kinase protein
MPAAEVAIDEALVARLVAGQFPELAGLDVAPLASGWDNAVFRLGPELVVRLPRRAVGAELVEHEQRWLPELAATLDLPLPIPAPIRCGHPALGYPWRWSVVPWFPGDVAARTPPVSPHDAAARLGGFVRALHVEAPADAPRNEFRGGPLAGRDEPLRARVDQLGELVDGVAVLALWDELVAVPAWDAAPVWLHGDLHPANVLVHQGRLSAVIDFGDLTAGDPATDLAVAWMLFAEDQATFRRASGHDGDDPTWRRARGWALHLAIAYLANSADHPLIASVGRRTLAAVLRSG